jgi:hypothetical protein
MSHSTNLFFIQIEMDALIINYIINLCSLCNKIHVKKEKWSFYGSVWFQDFFKKN